jgi:hypothetical protein
MTIYKSKRTSSRIYRKIYEQHYGSIPKDELGRTYEIHHIDSDHSNNDPTNLKAVTIQEHYDIHYAQQDWAACLFIATQRLNKTKEELSTLSKNAQRKLVNEGRHNFLGGNIQRRSNLNRVQNGTHPFLDKSIGRKANIDQVKNGTHPFLGGNIQRQSNLNRVQNGTHPSLIKVSCVYCQKTTGFSNFKRWHGSNCKKNY